MSLPRLTAAEILDVRDRPMLEVDVPEWGGSVLLAMMSGADVREWRRRLQARAPEDQDYIMADLLVMTLVNDEGKRLFETIDALNEKAATVLDRLFRKAVEHNRLSNTEVEKAKGES